MAPTSRLPPGSSAPAARPTQGAAAPTPPPAPTAPQGLPPKRADGFEQRTPAPRATLDPPALRGGAPVWVAMKDGALDVDATFRRLAQRGGVEGSDIGALERQLPSSVSPAQAYALNFWALVSPAHELTSGGRAALEKLAGQELLHVEAPALKSLADRLDRESPSEHRALVLGAFLKAHGGGLPALDASQGVKLSGGMYQVAETTGARSFSNAAALLEHYGLRTPRPNLTQKGEAGPKPAWLVETDGALNVSRTVSELRGMGAIDGAQMLQLARAASPMKPYDAFLFAHWAAHAKPGELADDGARVLLDVVREVLPKVEPWYLKNLVDSLGSGKPHDVSEAIRAEAARRGIL